MNFTGTVGSDGRLRLDAPEYFKEHAKRFRGKRVVLRLEVEADMRTDAQNRRLWKIMEISRLVLNQELEKRGESLRLSKEQVHRYFEDMFMSQIVEMTWTPLGDFRATCSQLTKAQMATFMDLIEAYMVTTFGASFVATEDEVREAGL